MKRSQKRGPGRAGRSPGKNDGGAPSMQIQLGINGERRTFAIAPGDLLLDVLRREYYFGVKRGWGNHLDYAVA